MTLWSTACPDWQSRIVERRSLVPFEPLFPDEANAAMDVLSSLRIVDAAGSPTIGEICRPWVTDIAKAVFGAYDAHSGRRLIRDFLILVSKKNSKSTLAAAIMLTALMRNWRMSAEFLILAPTIEVANNSFGPIRDMIKANGELSAILRVQDHTRTITHLNTGATLKVVAADNETVSGKKAVGVFIDELWLFGKRANAENMLREATGGLASRPEGFVIYATTQSDDAPAGVFKQKLQYFRDVRDGKVNDPKSLGFLYEFPPAMIDAKAYLDPENFYITNPNLGASVDREYLVDEFTKSQRAGEISLCGFLAKNLNVEIGLALRSDGWAGQGLWEGAGNPELTLAALLDRCEVVVAGIDGGGLDDLFALTILGREKVTRHWLAWSRAWVHVSVLKLREQIAPRLRDFEKQGTLSIFASPGDDIAELVDVMMEVESSGLLAGKGGVGLDPAGVGAIIDALADIEISGDDRVVAVSQGYRLQGAIKTAERKLHDGTLKHDGSAMMAWCVSNAKIELKGNAVMITKAASGVGKIDPLMSMFNAIALMSLNPDASNNVSYYETHDLVMI